MATYLITGASRGIGLELTKQLLELPASQVSKVFAVARNIESDAIKQLEQKYSDRLYPVSASVDNTASVQKAAEVVKTKLDGQSLDVLINNAGIGGETTGSIKDMELDQLTQIFDVNVVGVQRVTAAFFPLLEQGSQKKVINVYVHYHDLTWCRS
jgi:NAD(P)-dependent dehydrogenase (short-subunit alcohol dehydrogenase family)